MCLLNISYLIHAHPDLLLDTLISLLDSQYIIFYVLFARPVQFCWTIYLPTSLFLISVDHFEQ